MRSGTTGDDPRSPGSRRRRGAWAESGAWDDAARGASPAAMTPTPPRCQEERPRARALVAAATRAAPGVEVGLEHEGAGRGLRVRGQLLDVGDEHDRGEEVVDADVGGSRDLDDDGVATPFLGDELAFDELLADALGVGVLAVDLR